MDAERALQGAVLGRLKAEPALAALLGTPRRVWDQPPGPDADGDGPVEPYVVFTRSETRPLNADGGGLEHRLTLTAVSRFGGAEEAKAVVAGVRASLDGLGGGAAVELDGSRLVDLRVTYTDVFRASDLRRTYGVVRVRAVTDLP
jgi:hypothetical protein